MLGKKRKELVDKSLYKAEHDKVIAYVKEQIGINLNDYRDGDGTNPYTTTFWDYKGPKVCINWCGSVGGMNIAIQNKVEELVNKSKGRLLLEWGGAWFKFIYLRSEQ